MFPIDRCMQTLRILIAEGDLNGIVLAEKAVNDFIASHDNADRQSGALRVLEKELTAVWQFASGAQLVFANVVIDYIDSRVRALPPPEALG
jgi:hypothetical protein